MNETRNPEPQEGTMQDFSQVVAGTLPAGTVVPDGTIVRTSLTAYFVQGETDARWVPFRDIHGRPAPVEPLVTFG